MEGNMLREIVGLICFVLFFMLVYGGIISIEHNRETWKQIKEFIIKLYRVIMGLLLFIMVFIILCVISYIPYKIFILIFF